MQSKRIVAASTPMLHFRKLITNTFKFWLHSYKILQIATIPSNPIELQFSNNKYSWLILEIKVEQPIILYEDFTSHQKQYFLSIKCTISEIQIQTIYTFKFLNTL